MTTHRLTEAISFVAWFEADGVGAAPLHIRRPRSQKSVAYCDELVIETKRLPLVRDFTIDDPDSIPLEIRVERDFARLCPWCARMFYHEVAEENAELRWAGIGVTVPVTWQVIHTRAERGSSVQISVSTAAVARAEAELAYYADRGVPQSQEEKDGSDHSQLRTAEPPCPCGRMTINDCAGECGWVEKGAARA